MHVDWVKAYVAIWTDLQSYIKQHHTTGLSWSKSVSPHTHTHCVVVVTLMLNPLEAVSLPVWLLSIVIF